MTSCRPNRARRDETVARRALLPRECRARRRSACRSGSSRKPPDRGGRRRHIRADWELGRSSRLPPARGSDYPRSALKRRTRAASKPAGPLPDHPPKRRIPCRAPSRCCASRSSAPQTGNGKAATTRDHAWSRTLIGSRRRRRGMDTTTRIATPTLEQALAEQERSKRARTTP